MFITNNQAQLYTVEFGSGPRTILAHGGWTGSWELWTEPFMHLSKSWHTVAYDHRGTGVTIAPIESISIENMVADLFAVMNHMQIEKCVLAAESAGAIIAVNAVLQQPDRFEGLVLVDALLHGEHDAGAQAFISGLQNHFPQTIGGFVDACVPESETHSAEIRSWGRKILQRASPESAVKLLECTHGVDVRPQLTQIQIPTLIMHGSHDAIVPVAESEYTSTQIRNNQRLILEGAGHVPSITRPREVADAINQYFA